MDLQISKPITLSCGLTLPNRLVKAALAEAWADMDYLPSTDLIEAYSAWGKGGWGMVITGNVLIDTNHLSTPEDNAINYTIPREALLSRWKVWASACSKNGTPTVVQINHPGRQSLSWAGTGGIFSKSIAPSAIPLDWGNGLLKNAIRAAMFGTPREMTLEDIRHVIARFAETAHIAAEAGFAGVEIHAAHGYLLSQFLSSKGNHRTDEYGGSAKNRARIIVEVIHAIRDAVPKGFCVGIKLNSADHQGYELQDCIEQLEVITTAGIDFLEISGGTYETPTMLIENPKRAASTVAREAFFLDFAYVVREKFPDVHLVVTGGFRTRTGMEDAVKQNGCDMVGIGRPAIMNYSLPDTVVFNTEVKNEDAKLYAKRVASPWLAKALGLSSVAGGAETVFYQEEIHKMLMDGDRSRMVTTLGVMFKWLVGE